MKQRGTSPSASAVVLLAAIAACRGGEPNPAPAGGGPSVAEVPNDGAPTEVPKRGGLPESAPMITRPVTVQVEKRPPTRREEIGRKMFFDESLSTPPGTSCASCHAPRRAFSGNHGSTLGVPAGSRPGHFARRNTPSLLYLKYVPTFHFALADDDDVNPLPYGGLTWNGRADSVAEFVRMPLLDPDEMNNASEADLSRKLRGAPYAEDIAAEFPGALDAPAKAVDALGEALQAYLTSDAMAPFTSRFDDYLRGTATLSDLEMRGLAAFKSPEKGACDGCHRFVESSKRTSRSLFTDFGYDAVAVPRNEAIPANHDPAHSDLGLCERKQRHPPSSAPQWCASFRTPSLRNVAVRERFMHNGAFTKLRDVVAFYATRATSPSRWYPAGKKWDDVPAKYTGSVNVTSLPYNRPEGAKPPLDDEDIDAIVAFLETLTDAHYRGEGTP